ncbi:MAG TPA: DNA polymerase, partial [Sphaerochaeta sp.]|nr:DNA polymerase [Sphaerochaeta sp.]
MTNDSMELFGEQDFDQKKLEKEASLRPSVVIEKREEKTPEENEEDREGGTVGGIKGRAEPTQPSSEKKLYIIDGYALIYRSYYAFINNPMKDPQGNNISAVYGFFATLLKLLRENNPEYMVVAMDSHGPTFRHDMYEPYKANREAAPEDLHSQVPIINAILKALEIPMVAMMGFEADDIIATLSQEATRHNIDTIMFTGDKDLLQLVDEHIFALRPAKKGESVYRLMGSAEVQQEFGVLPSQVVDYLSLVGDSSDNVPGVKGIGPKGASKLLQQFGTLEEIYKNIRLCAKGEQKKLTEGSDLAKLSKSLVELKRDLFTVDSFDTEEYLLDDLNYKAAIPLFEELGMNSIPRELEKLANGGVAPKKQDVVKQAMKSAKKGSYEAVVTLERVEELLAQAEQAGGIIAFDLETDSLDAMAAKPLGFSFSWEEGVAYYVPIISEGERLFSDEDLKGILSEFLPTGRLSLVGQNIKYDYKVLVNWGVVPKRLLFDTMVGAWLLDSTGVFNMDYLAEKYLEYKTLSYKDAIPKGKTVGDIPQEQAVFYGAEDADVTFRLYKLFSNLLVARGLMSLMENLEMPLLRIIATMEIEGIFLDRTRIEPLTAEFEKRIETIQEKIFAICGHEFNLNSPKQLQEVLFVEREIPTGAKTRTGFSTATDVLEPLSGTYPEVALV